MTQPISTIDNSARTRVRHGIILSIILIVALLLRLHQLGADSLWHDECWSVEMTVGRDARQLMLPETGVIDSAPDLFTLDPAFSWTSIWSHCTLDDHPALYAVCLRTWRGMFGDSDAALRSMSLVFSLLAIVLLFDAVHTFNGPVPALWTAALMAVAIPQIQYAQEVRSYGLLMFEGALVLSALARLERTSSRIWPTIALTLGFGLMAITHYASIGTLGAVLFYSIIRLRKSARLCALLAITIATVTDTLLWLPQLRRQLAVFDPNTVTWMAENRAHPLPASLARMALSPGRCLVDTLGMAQAITACFAIAIFLLPLIALRRRPQFMLWWSWMIGTLLGVFAFDLVNHSRQLGVIRYSLLASPAVYALIAVTAGMIAARLSRPKLQHALAGLLLIAVAINIPRQAYHPEWRPDWRGVAAAISSQIQPGEIICCVGPCDEGFWDPDTIYAPLSRYLHPFPSPVVMLQIPPRSEAPIENPMNDPRVGKKVWAVVAGPGIDTHWPQAGWVIDSSQPFSGIGVLQHLHR